MQAWYPKDSAKLPPHMQFMSRVVPYPDIIRLIPDIVYVAGHFIPLVNSFPNQVNLSQPRSICFNLGQFSDNLQVIVWQYRKYQLYYSLKLTLGLIRPKQNFLGLISASGNS